uniref:Uncharacterized protein n=1 Tax=Cucumis melo TaxID=3656 RepID=A0A9I9EBN0_CUCME
MISAIDFLEDECISLARYWGLAPKYGICMDIVVTNTTAFEIVISAGQKAKRKFSQKDLDPGSRNNLVPDISHLTGEGKIENILLRKTKGGGGYCACFRPTEASNLSQIFEFVLITWKSYKIYPIHRPWGRGMIGISFHLKLSSKKLKWTNTRIYYKYLRPFLFVGDWFDPAAQSEFRIRYPYRFHCVESRVEYCLALVQGPISRSIWQLKLSFSIEKAWLHLLGQLNKGAKRKSIPYLKAGGKESKLKGRIDFSVQRELV